MEKQKATKLQGDFPIFLSQSIHDQIRFADTKAAWTFSVLSVGTGALVTKVSNISPEELQKALPMTFIAIAVILIILAFKHVIRVIYPRIAKGNRNGIFYFEDIIQNKKDEYSTKGTTLTDQEIISSLYQQTHSLSQIASRKFKALQTSMKTTVVAILAIIIVFLIA